MVIRQVIKLTIAFYLMDEVEIDHYPLVGILIVRFSIPLLSETSILIATTGCQFVLKF